MPRGTSLYDEMRLQRQLEPEAQDYIERVERVERQATDSVVRVAINDFVRGCKIDGNWKAIKASCILAGARTLAGALVPLVGPAPTNFDFLDADYSPSTGLKGNGTTKYLDSNRGNANQPQNSSHLAVFHTQYPTPGRVPIGGGGSVGASQMLIAATPTPRIFFRINYGSGSVHHPTTATDLGLLGANRADSAGVTGRIGGVNFFIADVSAVPVAQNVLVFARNPSLPINFSDGRNAFYSIGESVDLALLDARLTALLAAFKAIP